MKASERDDLLIRLDERSRNIYTLVEKQERHLEELNSTTRENTTGVAVNRSGIKRIYWIMGGIVLLVIGFAGGIIPNL